MNFSELVDQHIGASMRKQLALSDLRGPRTGAPCKFASTTWAASPGSRPRPDSDLTHSLFATLPFQTASTSSLPRRGTPFSLISGSVASSIALRRKTRVSL